MKSAYELTMERLNKSAPTVKLTAAQKKQLAELDSITKAKIAQLEITLKGEIAAAAEAGNAEELAAEMLATTLNVEFDPDLSWDEKKEVYRISNKIVRTMNVTQSAVGDKRGLWTTVLGAAILIGEDD